jgi:hypothetical protein
LAGSAWTSRANAVTPAAANARFSYRLSGISYHEL